MQRLRLADVIELVVNYLAYSHCGATGIADIEIQISATFACMYCRNNIVCTFNIIVMFLNSELAFVHFYLILDRVPKYSNKQSLPLYNPFKLDAEISRN